MHKLVIKNNPLSLTQRYQNGIALQHFIVLRESLGNVWTALGSKYVMAARNNKQSSILSFCINQRTPQVEGRVLRFVYEVEILMCFDLSILWKLYHQV